MAEMMLLLKPGPFVLRKAGDPEQLFQDFTKYVANFEEFLIATGAAGEHKATHADCTACTKAKATLRLIGGDEMKSLFDHVGEVTAADTFDQAVKKISDGIKTQTNQATARFKLFQQMPQAGQCFSEWYTKVREQADRCVWTGYDAKSAARDAILYQTDAKNLMKKIISEDLNFDDTVKYGLAMEQGARKVDQIRGNSVRKEDERMAALEEKVRALQSKNTKAKKPCRTCTRPTHDVGKCPGKKVDCYACGQTGHFKGSAACGAHARKTRHNKKAERTRAVTEDGESETDSEDMGRVIVTSTEGVRALQGHTNKSETAEINIVALDHGTASQPTTVKLLIDSGVSKTLLSEADWAKIKPQKGNPKLKLKKNKTNFTPFGTNIRLPIRGRTKCKLTAACGSHINTIVYVVKGEEQSLLGLKDGEALGIIKINPEGAITVRQLSMEVKISPPTEGTVSGNQTQQEIDENMKQLTSKYERLFQGLGKAAVEPVHIEIDPMVKPIQQKQRPIALQYKQRFKQHIEELQQEDVVSGPLDSNSARGWISNVVITHKSWSDKKIRVNLDTRPMSNAVKTSHFPIPTPQELRHNFVGSDRFSVVDLNHAFHQFEMDEESKNLFVFYGPEGRLLRFNRLVMGTSSASSECHERIRRIVEGLEGIQQIKDDVVVHGKGVEHDQRLEALFKRFREFNITLRKEKCHFGMPQVKWFGHIYSKQGMSADPAKVEVIKAWPRPADKSEVKSFLQTVQFCQVFMRPSQTGGARTYSDITLPLRRLTVKNVKYKWTRECEDSFQELKTLLTSERVMGNYEPSRPTRIYVDDGPAGVAATVAQEYTVEDIDHPVWRPVDHTSRAKTKSEMNYGKVDGESLAVLTGIRSNKMYLYGTRFTVVVDHEPLLPMYNGHSKSLPFRVAKHKSKLRGFDFQMVYEPGVTTPADYGSRHPPPARTYTSIEREELGIEEEEEDAEIIVNRIGEVADAVTLPILKHHTEADPTLRVLLEDIKAGHLRTETRFADYKDFFRELSVKDGIILRDNRLLIPTTLRPDVLGAAHEGHPAKDSMTRQLRQSVWWPGITKDIKEYVSSCLGCAAAENKNRPPPMIERQTPIGPWVDCSADFKGPIAGKYYFHVLIDNYSRWPEVEVVSSTSFEQLRPAVDRSFGLLGIPSTITHDNGPPYQSSEWKKYAKEMGFEMRPCTPEHPEANGIAERFMAVIVKTVHAAIAEGNDPKTEVRRRLMNYRNTPHPSTGKSPSELIMGRLLKTKIAALITPARGRVHEEAKQKDKQTRAHRKQLRDQKKNAITRTITPGDKVLIKQQKTTTKPPFDPKPYTVTKVKGTQVTATRGSKTRVRNAAKVKQLLKRPSHLETRKRVETNNNEEDDEDYINLRPTTATPTRPTGVVQAAAGDCRRFSRRTLNKPKRLVLPDWRR